MREAMQVWGPAKHGLYSNQMALITSDFDAMRIHDHQMALITSDCDAMQSGSSAPISPIAAGDVVKVRRRGAQGPCAACPLGHKTFLGLTRACQLRDHLGIGSGPGVRGGRDPRRPALRPGTAGLG